MESLSDFTDNDKRALWGKIKRDAPLLAEAIKATYARFGKVKIVGVQFPPDK